MKYFTRKWAEGKMTEKAAETVRQKYLDNLYEIREQLPAPLRELAYENLEGASILKLKIDKINKLLQLKLRTEESELEITYDQVQYEDTQDAVLQERAQDPNHRILFNEIDIGKTGYEHRFLLDQGEAIITFRAIRTRKKA